jgi:hypothetical protein
MKRWIVPIFGMAFLACAAAAGAEEGAAPGAADGRVRQALEGFRDRPSGELAEEADAVVAGGWIGKHAGLDRLLADRPEDLETLRAADWGAFFEGARQASTEPMGGIRFLPLRNAARALLLDARKAEADRRPADALAGGLRVLRLSEEAARDGGLVSYAAAVRLRQMAYPVLRDTAVSGASADAERRALVEALERALAGTGRLPEAVRHELEWALRTMRAFFLENPQAEAAPPAKEFYRAAFERTAERLKSHFGRLEEAARERSVEKVLALQREIEERASRLEMGNEEFESVEALERRYRSEPSQLQDELLDAIADRLVLLSAPGLKSPVEMALDAERRYRSLLDFVRGRSA